MNIIIVGSGKIGFALAKELSLLNHDISVIDTNEEVLENSSNMLDVNCISGNGVYMDVLMQAGADTADLIITVTGNDELNIVICVVAKSLGTKNMVARIRNPEYTGEIELLKNGMGLSRIINPEFEAAVEISRLFALPAANKIDAFASERVEIAEYTIEETDALVGKSLDKISFPSNFLICGLEKHTTGEFLVADGSLVCETGDRIYMAGTLLSLSHFFKNIGHSIQKAKNIMIIGGSRTAVFLARIAMKMGIKVKLIEQDVKRGEQLAKLLPDCMIICGDGTDEEVLLSEDLKQMDAFVSLTENDEENILSACYAKYQGVPKVIPKINRTNYIHLAERLGLESVVCPKLVTSDHVVRYVQSIDNARSDAMQKLFRVADGKAEAVVFLIPPDSRVVGRTLEKIKFKKDILIAAVVRGKEVTIPTGKKDLQAGDQVLVFSKNPQIEEFEDILE